MIKLTKVTKFKYCFSSEDSDEEEIIKTFLKVKSEGYDYLSAEKKRFWDGFIRFYDTNNQFYSGLLLELVEKLEKEKIKFFIDEKRINKRLIKNYKLKEFLNPHQKDAINSFFQNNYGIIKIPTRGRKTVISIESIRIVKEFDATAKILFFVDGVDLLDQQREEIAKHLGLKIKDIGTINDKGFYPKDITIAMIQSVQGIFSGKKKKTPEFNKRKREIFKFLKSINFAIVDELHEYSSAPRLRVLNKLENVDWLMGLSATPFKGNNFIGNTRLKGYFGGVIYEISEQELKKRKILAKDKIILIMIEHLISFSDYKKINSEKGIFKYQALQNKFIFDNKLRDKILYLVIKICRDLCFKTLVLFTSKVHGRKISNSTGLNFLCGDDKKEYRKEVKENFLKGRGKILLASDIFKKGITLPEVEIFVNADGGFEETGIIQKKGRVLGTTETKKLALSIDILDISEYFSDHSLSRLSVYEESVGSKGIDVFEATDFDLEISIRESIINWFNK